MFLHTRVCVCIQLRFNPESRAQPPAPLHHILPGTALPRPSVPPSPPGADSQGAVSREAMLTALWSSGPPRLPASRPSASPSSFQAPRLHLPLGKKETDCSQQRGREERWARGAAEAGQARGQARSRVLRNSGHRSCLSRPGRSGGRVLAAHPQGSASAGTFAVLWRTCCICWLHCACGQRARRQRTALWTWSHHCPGCRRPEPSLTSQKGERETRGKGPAQGPMDVVSCVHSRPFSYQFPFLLLHFHSR